MRSRPLSVPTPLVLLLAAVLVVGTAWALVLPPWQSPDEQWHFAYAQTLAEHGRLPDAGNPASFSSEQRLAAASSRSDRMPFHPELRAPWDESRYDAWQRNNARLPATRREDGGGVNNASSNPPLFYAVEAVPYKVAGGDVFDRLYAMRFVSVLFLLVAVVATWLLAGELFGPNRTLQLVAAAVVGFQPMATFMGGSLNPDSPLLAFWSLALWLGVRILRRGLTTKSGVALAAVAGGAVLTKAIGYLVVIAAAILIGWKLWRQRSWDTRGLLAVAAGCVLVAVLPFAVAEVTGRTAFNQVGNTTGNNLSLFDFPADYLGSYLWQFYLPRPSFLRVLPGGIDHEYGFDVVFRGGWGLFGWKDVRLTNGVYTTLLVTSIATVAAAALALITRRVKIERAVLAYLLLVALALVAALHWIEFRFVVERGEAFIQGRYLLPLLPLGACALGAALTMVPSRLRGAAVGVALVGLLSLQVVSLSAVMERYFA
jgi:4-amino-4-deoxy-L-arabinose transferase-like glycosyltransferase